MARMVDLTIAGRTYQVACREGEEESLRAAARLVDGKSREAIAGLGTLSEARQFLFASLLLADQLVDDKPGIVSSIAGALAKVGANIDSLLQRPGYPKHSLPFVVTTEPCPTSVIEKAINSIAKLDCMLERPLTLQMLVPEDKPE